MNSLIASMGSPSPTSLRRTFTIRLLRAGPATVSADTSRPPGRFLPAATSHLSTSNQMIWSRFWFSVRNPNSETLGLLPDRASECLLMVRPTALSRRTSNQTRRSRHGARNTASSSRRRLSRKRDLTIFRRWVSLQDSLFLAFFLAGLEKNVSSLEKIALVCSMAWLGRVTDWRRCSLGPAYPRPVFRWE